VITARYGPEGRWKKPYTPSMGKKDEREGGEEGAEDEGEGGGRGSVRGCFLTRRGSLPEERVLEMTTTSLLSLDSSTRTSLVMCSWRKARLPVSLAVEEVEGGPHGTGEVVEVVGGVMPAGEKRAGELALPIPPRTVTSHLQGDGQYVW